MIEHILIPTLGRMDKQATYNALPEKYQEITKLVVQHHEYDEMCKRYPDRVLCLPKDIDRLPETKAWIYQTFKNTRHFYFDDDIKFHTKAPSDEISNGIKNGAIEKGRPLTRKEIDAIYDNAGSPKWKTNRTPSVEEFDHAFNLCDQWMDEGYHFGGFLPAEIIPFLHLWPERFNYRCSGAVYFNGPELPDDLDWTRTEAAEDLDTTLQLLTRGYQCRINSNFIAYSPPTNEKGGCSIYRTLELHNKSQEKLASLWPDYISLKDKKVKSGPWAGLVKKNLRIQFKKAYKDYLKKQEQQ